MFTSIITTYHRYHTTATISTTTSTIAELYHFTATITTTLHTQLLSSLGLGGEMKLIACLCNYNSSSFVMFHAIENKNSLTHTLSHPQYITFSLSISVSFLLLILPYCSHMYVYVCSGACIFNFMHDYCDYCCDYCCCILHARLINLLCGQGMMLSRP